jgi:glycine cleavage system H lipoate-binding protein
MSTILAILMILALVLTDHLRRKKKATPVFTRQYVHPGHTWMRMTGDGDVMVGVDEFAAGVIGEISAITLPRYLKKIRQGEPSFTIDNNGRSITFVSPLTGRVVEKNEMVLSHPALAIVSPLRDGWLFKIHPANLPNETRNLMTGKWADLWMDMARTHLLRLLSLNPVPVSQDGGRIDSNLAIRCSDAEWKTLKRELFFDTEVIDIHSTSDQPARQEVAQ